MIRSLAVVATAIALAIGARGLAVAQAPAQAPTQAPASPSPLPQTAPPERLEGSTRTNNPATATTPTPAPSNAPAAVPNTDARRTNKDSTQAPATGANSFTEDQARSRIKDGGYTQVGALKLDDQGVWRGTAVKDGQSVPVALDFKGNVTAR